MAKPKGGQKLMQQAKRGRIKAGLRDAQRKFRLQEYEKRTKEIEEKTRRMRPRRRGDPSLAGGRRKGSPSV
jgi:hypothetical protein